MRDDLIGLFSLIYKNAFFKVDSTLSKKNNRVYLLLNMGYVRSFLACLRFSSLFYGTIFHDIIVVDASHINTIVYVYYLPRWDIKLFLITRAERVVPAASEFFPGAAWPERECSEMFGVVFREKIDTRRLLLDYTFEGYPLRKDFSVNGYEEIEYSTFYNWVVYKPLKLRDGDYS